MRGYKYHQITASDDGDIIFDTDALFIVDAIKELDPIGLDDDLEALRHANEQNDVSYLVSLLCTLTKRANALRIDRPEVAYATMRDIGLVLGSIKRHGVEPCSAVPDVELLLGSGPIDLRSAV